MTSAEKAYVGAIIDGEGTVVHNVPRGQYKIQVGNYCLEMISALIRATGRGGVTLNRRNPNGDMWCWYVCNKADVHAICTAIAPYSLKAQRFLGAVPSPIKRVSGWRARTAA